MKLDAEQLEWVVREVVRRLSAVSDSGRSCRCQQSGHRETSKETASRELALAGRVIAVSNLSDRLDGIAQVRIEPGAVVTPSARDLLQERGVELIRQG